MGDDPEQLGKSVTELARSIGCDDLYIMGFSSGGYPGLLASSLMECKGYLGFSIRTGSGCHDDPLPRRNVFSAAQKYWIATRVPSRFRGSMRRTLETRIDECDRMLIVGERDELDMIHASDVAHCPGFTILKLENCGHDTVSASIERGIMDELIKRLLRI